MLTTDETPLKSPPLVEAILEMRWELQQGNVPQARVDPHYSLVLGKLHGKIDAEYPFHERLPIALVPDELSAYKVKHRFRKAPHECPLVQIGPGVLTLNETTSYSTYQTFRPRAESLLEAFLSVYPEIPKFSMLLLRYIDAVDVDFHHESVWAFMLDKMGVPVDLPDAFFDDTGVRKQPQHFVWETAFPCEAPSGTATLRFATGERKGTPSLVWEQMLRSEGADVPDMPGGFLDWLDGAHLLTESWFQTLIDGALRERFNR
ncbi:TIGR04255 family protein [Planctomycetota bacterium]